jgi:hypothetical protein
LDGSEGPGLKAALLVGDYRGLKRVLKKSVQVEDGDLRG